MSEEQRRSAEHEQEIEEYGIKENEEEGMTAQEEAGEQMQERKAGRSGKEDRIFEQRDVVFQNQYFTEIYGSFHRGTDRSSDRTARHRDLQLKILTDLHNMR